jgi:endonuclease/exonuclease/phosphatase family metal-dependent hydrolase
MKLIQFNAWGGALGRHTSRWMKQQDVDIWMVQEVTSSPSAGRSRFFDFLEDALAAIGSVEVFSSKIFSSIYGKKQIHYGNAILAKQKLENRYTEFTKGEYEPDFSGVDEDNNDIRLFQHATITNDKGVVIHLINYHGYCQANGVKTGDAETDAQCQQLADYIAKLTGPKILAGDFNLAPDSSSLKSLNAMLRNLCLEFPVETTRNLFSYVMDTVDYIWVSDEIIVKHFEVMPDLVSDHAALLLEFDV